MEKKYGGAIRRDGVEEGRCEKPVGMTTNDDAYYPVDKYDRSAEDEEGTFETANPEFERASHNPNLIVSYGEEHKTGMEEGPTNSFHTWEHHRERRVIRKFGREVNVPEEGAHNLE